MPTEAPVRPTKGGRSPTKTELFASQVRRNQKVVTDEDLYQSEGIGREGQGIESGGSVSKTGIIQIAMYKPTATGDFVRRLVPATHLDMNLDNGWLAFCPYCGEDCGDEINSCPEKDPRKFRKCPICLKPFVDPGDQLPVQEGDKDPFEIDQEVVASTPEIRTLNLLRDHMFAYHPKESRNYAKLLGVDPKRAEEERKRLGMPSAEERASFPVYERQMEPVQEN